MKKLNKQDLIDYIAKENDNLNGTQSKAAVNAVLEGIVGLLGDTAAEETPDEKGMVVVLSLVGFGNFKVKHKAEQEHRNPHNGEKAVKPAHNSPSFTPGKALKEYVSGQ